MFTHYYYNKNVDENGNHEVHTKDCSYLPEKENLVYIGFEQNCHSAIKKAKQNTGKSNFDGCWHCCRECHRG